MTSQVPQWLNAEFIQKVLRNSENDESIEVTDLVSEPAIGKGENYGSIMIRSKVKYSRGKSSLNRTEKKSLIIKIAPMILGSHKELIEKIGAFDTEIKMMTTTLIEMNDILKEDDYRLNPRVLYTKVGDPSLLVIEDLAALGYRMADRRVGLDLEHCFLAIRGLAKFHASSVALYEKDPSAMATYNGGMYNADYPADYKEFFTRSLKNVANEILKWTELGSRAQIYSEKLSKLSEAFYERAVRCTRPKDDEFNVMNHGDFWINNMLFRYNEDGKVTDHIFVDFQLSFWSSPAIDIVHFLNTSVAENVDLHHRDTLVEEYLSTLTRTMKRICCKTQPPSMAELEKALREHELYGMLSSCVVLPILLLEKNEAANFEELLQPNSGNNNSTYKGLAYRRIMMRRLPEWNARGLMD